MTELHERQNNINFVPKEGQRGLLCSNKESIRCPSFGFSSPNLISEDDAIDYLAEVLIEAFLDKKRHEQNKFKKCGYILPSFN